MGAGLLAILGLPYGLAPIVYLAFISHFPLDDLNVGDVRVEHMMETFDPEWQTGHTTLRVIWWLAILATTITLAVLQLWWVLICVTAGGVAAFSFDIIRHFWPKIDPHKIIYWKFWHNQIGSMVWYGSIFVCVVLITTAILIKFLRG